MTLILPASRRQARRGQRAARAERVVGELWGRAAALTALLEIDPGALG
jgi:hypothetical protein